MTLRRLHVVKVPTTRRDIFPYSHYADAGHDPRFVVNPRPSGEPGVLLTCSDSFKLKPNVQRSPRTRLDIYMPGEAALEIADDIAAVTGFGELARPSGTNPEASRRGPKTLPLIRDSRAVGYSSTTVTLAGVTITGANGRVFIDSEAPNEGHIEMKGPEVHLGLRLTAVNGVIDDRQVSEVTVPYGELRVAGETNPIRKVRGLVAIELDLTEAQELAATLKAFGNS